MKTEEIHFYTNLTDVEQTSDWDLETMLTDYVSTNKAINDGIDRVIKTTQLSFLENAWFYKDNGIRVFIHNNGHEIEVKEHMDVCEKDIRKAHNIHRLLIGGVFGEIK